MALQLQFKDIILGLQFLKSKKDKKSQKQTTPINTHLTGIAQPSQNKFFNSVKQFIKEKALLDAQSKASLVAKRIFYVGKMLAILSMMGFIGYKIYQMFAKTNSTLKQLNFFKFVEAIKNSIVKLKENITKLVKEINRCDNNYYTFIRENWENGINIKEYFRSFTIGTGEFLGDLLIKSLTYIYDKIVYIFTSIDNTDADVEKELSKDPSVDLSPYSARDPSDDEKYHNLESIKKPLEPVENEGEGEDISTSVEEKKESDGASGISQPSESGFTAVAKWAYNTYNTVKGAYNLIKEAVFGDSGSGIPDPDEAKTKEDEGRKKYKNSNNTSTTDNTTTSNNDTNDETNETNENVVLHDSEAALARLKLNNDFDKNLIEAKDKVYTYILYHKRKRPEVINKTVLQNYKK